MVTNFSDYITDSEEFRGNFGGIKEGQLERDLFNKTFSNQVKSYENDTLNQRIHFWLLIHWEGPIPDIINIYHMDEIIILWRNAADPDMQELLKNTLVQKSFPQMTNKPNKIFIKEIVPNHQKRIMLQIYSMVILLMTCRV